MVLKRIYILLSYFSDQIIVNSESLMEELSRTTIGGSKVNMDFIPNTFESPRFKQRNHEKDEVIIGYSGRIAKKKNLSVILNVAEYLRVKSKYRFKVLLAGDGEYLDNLSEDIIKKNLQECVYLIGYIENIPEFLSTLDIFLFPSLFEGMPNSVLEAMAYGLPVVAFNVVGVRDLVINGNTGTLVEAGNQAQINKSVEELINNQELRHLMGKNAQSFINENYNPYNVSCLINNLFERTQQHVSI